MSSGSSDFPLRRRILTAAAVSLLLALPAFGKGLFVSPNTIFATVTAGEGLARQITVTPVDGRAARVSVRVEAFDLDETGNPRHGAASNAEPSRVARIDVSPRILLLDGASPKVVEVRCEPPAKGEGSFWAVVLLEVEPVRTRTETGEEADVIARFAVPVFLTVQGTERPGLRVEKMAANVPATDRIELEAVIENVGNTVLRTFGAWAAEEKEYELASSDLEEVIVLPGERRRVHGLLRGTFPSAPRISGHLWLRFGTRADQVAEAECAVADRPRQVEPAPRAF